jgi:outer membrane protein
MIISGSSHTNKRLRTLVCALSCLVVTSTAVLAKAPPAIPTPQQIAEYEATDEVSRVALLIRLCKAGQHELADVLLSHYPLTGEFAANRKLFLEGMILYGRGNLTGAAKKYRQALADDPSLTLVRAELAQTLFQLQEDDSAKHHLGLLVADAPTEQAAQGIRSFIDTIDARRPFTFNTYVSLAPSTNVNNGSSYKTVYAPGGSISIPDEYQQKSGVGFTTGLNVGYSHRLGNDFSVVLGGGINGRIYDDSDFNSYGASQSAELRYLLNGGFIGVGAIASESTNYDISQDKYDFYNSYGPRISLQKAVSTQDQINLSAIHEWRNYKINPGSEGTALQLNGSWTHAFNSATYGTLDVGFDNVRSQNDYSSYRAYSLGASIYKELPFGVTASLRGEIRIADFEGVMPIYNLVRDDNRYTGTLNLTKRDFNIFGYAPGIEYTYVYNDSNIANFKFDSHAVDFRLSKDF